MSEVLKVVGAVGMFNKTEAIVIVCRALNNNADVLKELMKKVNRLENEVRMTRHEREITKKVYDHAKANRDYITADDRSEVFTISELIGYGVYGAQVFERDGKYYVGYSLGSTCD